VGVGPPLSARAPSSGSVSTLSPSAPRPHWSSSSRLWPSDVVAPAALQFSVPAVPRPSATIVFFRTSVPSGAPPHVCETARLPPQPRLAPGPPAPLPAIDELISVVVPPLKVEIPPPVPCDMSPATWLPLTVTLVSVAVPWLRIPPPCPSPNMPPPDVLPDTRLSLSTSVPVLATRIAPPPGLPLPPCALSRIQVRVAVVVIPVSTRIAPAPPTPVFLSMTTSSRVSVPQTSLIPAPVTRAPPVIVTPLMATSGGPDGQNLFITSTSRKPVRSITRSSPAASMIVLPEPAPSIVVSARTSRSPVAALSSPVPAMVSV
jgi:hypothetical protein